MKMTAKQQKFADYYIELGNAAEAARKAGYSKRTARSIGQENLTKPDVKEYVSKRLEELANERVADQQEVLEFLTRLMRREESDQVVVTLKKPTSVMLKNKDGESYSKFAYEDIDDVVDVKTKNSDAIKAADILSRLQGMGNNANNTLTENQSRKVSAEADIMEAKAKRKTSEDGTDAVNVNIIVPNSNEEQNDNE